MKSSSAPPAFFVAFDTETTGLSPVDDRVVELAAIAFTADGTERGSFESFVDPGIPIPASLSRIHGITDQMVAGKPRLEEVLPEFFRLAGGAALVAHNAPYDVAMMLVPMTRSGTPAPGNLVLDTCSLARAAFPGFPNYRLSTVAGQLGIPVGRAHRAMSDVRACKEILLRVLGTLPASSGPEDLVRLNQTHLRFAHGEEHLADSADGHAATLRDSLRRASPLTIRYEGGTKGTGPRRVTPILLLRKDGIAYMLAHCHLDGSLKEFRLDRVFDVL